MPPPEATNRTWFKSGRGQNDVGEARTYPKITHLFQTGFAGVCYMIYTIFCFILFSEFLLFSADFVETMFHAVVGRVLQEANAEMELGEQRFTKK